MAQLKTITVSHRRLGRCNINEADFDPAVHKREGEPPDLKVVEKDQVEETGKGKARR